MASLLVAVIGSTLQLTLARPQVRNAIDRATALAIAGALDRLDEDPSLRVAIITGAGGTFCSGMDLNDFLVQHGEILDHGGRGFAGITARPPAKPVIAAVEGYALAGGFEIALACDLIVAGASATFGIPEVQRGLVAAAGGLFRLPGVISRNVAMELALTGDPIGALRAYDLGLVNRVVEPGRALPAAHELACRIAENAPLSVLAAKAVISQSVAWDPATAFLQQAKLIEPVIGSTDAIEGARAFTEKRRPVWLGQ